MQFCHTSNGVFHAHQSLGIVCMDGNWATGILTLGLVKMDLAIRYMLVGLLSELCGTVG